ncbi:cytochrome b/b6 domain-containing protein [Ideonella sp. YS5]|uniref:cytochrome b/b6 domain-containing protein n=1 Tax=Ideonella sp. YS5 TaxID=3453714 RepID=UPI003EEBE532
MPPVEEPAPQPPAVTPIRVWDLPTRLFHGLLAAAVIGLLLTGPIGGHALAWHMRLGLSVGALILFRLLWGMVGGRWSRFRSFVHSPSAFARYLRGRPLAEERFDVGHSPLGSLSVFALLLLLAAQVATGLVADDEIATTGPLNRFVASSTASLATHWHKAFGRWLIWAWIGLHLAAIAWHVLVRHRALLRPMWTGDKLLPAGTPPSTDSAGTRLLAILLVIACGALATWVAGLG